MNEPKDPEAAETVQTTSDKAVDPAATCSRFRAGDTVRHLPSEEEWILACDEEDGRVAPCGWPSTLADAKDCELIAAATEEERIAMLKTWCRQYGSDYRIRAAHRQLPGENTSVLFGIAVAVDFDGTCVTHEFPKVGREIGAARVLKRMTDAGAKLILWTMRSDGRTAEVARNGKPMENPNPLTDAVKWFEKHGIPLYGIQRNPTQDEWTTSPKAYAQIYIDDAALGCPLKAGLPGEKPHVDWDVVEAILLPNVDVDTRDLSRCRPTSCSASDSEGDVTLLSDSPYPVEWLSFEVRDENENVVDTQKVKYSLISRLDVLQTLLNRLQEIVKVTGISSPSFRVFKD